MFELFIVGAAIFIGGVYLFKFFFFVIGVILTSIGFFLKAVITIVVAIIFFPLTIFLAGGILSSGFVGLLLVFALLGALSPGRAQNRPYY